MNLGFIIDNRKCIGCHACTVACKAEHDVPIGVNRTWVKYIEKGRFPHTRRLFSVLRCNHCEDAPCVEICPVTALYKRDDGIVDFDNRRCIGCKACTQACPYDAIYIDPQTHTAAKCNYCAHRVDVGLLPACVNVCPEHAIISGDLDDPMSEISQLLSREQVTARKVEKGTRPKLFYIEGDEASLKPVSTEPASTYMWSSQSAGVGHFAKYAEERIAQADEKQMSELLASGSDRWVGEEKGMNRVLVPAGFDDGRMLDRALQVVKERAWRVYDAPAKGTLWGWEVAAYIWTKAISTGAYLVLFLALAFGFAPVSGTIQNLGLGLGLTFLALTGLLLVKDLDRPTRFAYVLLRPQWGSWLVRGGYAITLYGALLTLWGLARGLAWTTVEKSALWGAAVLAILTAAYTAFLFAQAKGRDFWQSPILPFHMIGHAIAAGAAVFAIFLPVLDGDAGWAPYLRTVLYISIAFNLIILAAELLSVHATQDAKLTAHAILSGRFSRLFWVGTFVVGNVLPLLLLLWFGGTVALTLAGVLVLVGMYITEHIWVHAPQLIPLS